MKAWIVNNRQLTLKDLPRPVIKANEVLVKFVSWSLNYRDLVVRAGEYGASKNDLIPLSDAAGEIIECGSAVRDYNVADRVMPIFMPQWQSGELKLEYGKGALGNLVDGTLCEYAALPATALVKVPEQIDSISAATLPCAGLTAWNALVTAGNLRAGQKVLLLGTGGVSVFALQIAKTLGAEVFITSGSNEKLNKAKGLGADHLINYRDNPEWSKTIWEITNKQGVDIVVETGGADTFNQSLQCAGANATISLIGVLSGTSSKVNLPDIYRRMLQIKGIFVGSRENLESFTAFYAKEKLKPVIDKTFTFEQAAEAYDYFRRQEHFGKILVRRYH